MSIILMKYNDINFDEEIDICGCIAHPTFLYNNKRLYLQTPFYENYSIPSSSAIIPELIFLENISSRSYIKVKMTPDMDNYNFYQKLDKFLDTNQFRTRIRTLHNSFNTDFEYDPIIKSRENLGKRADPKFGSFKYFLPYERTRIGVPDGTFSDDHDTKMLAYFKSDDDEFYKYTSFNYKLFKNVDGIRQQINFDSFDEFTSHVNQGTNIRFIIKPRLFFRKKYGPPYKNTATVIYFIRLDITTIEIK
jgi:hypothetical protein